MVQLNSSLVALASAAYLDISPLATFSSRCFHLLNKIPHFGHSLSASVTGAWHWGQAIMNKKYKNCAGETTCLPAGGLCPLNALACFIQFRDHGFGNVYAGERGAVRFGSVKI